MSRVKIIDLVKRFGKVVAVNNVNLEVKDGEFLVLLGPSGCGKTTLLRCISGLEEVTSGRIYFGDKDVTYVEPRRRNVSMVFQNYAVWPHLTVFENIAFPLKVKGYTDKDIEDKVRWASDLLNIAELLDRYPHQLSGGQKQRVAVARAIVFKPEVLLMDEPLSNLDALLRVRMRSEIKKLQEKLNITTIYVTHDQVEAMVMGDRIAVMKDGIVQQIGSSDEIYHKPANMFVAGFIGSPQMNFIEVSLQNSEGTYVLKTDGLEIKLNVNSVNTMLIKPSNYIMGIRPEDIHHRFSEDKKDRMVAIKGVIYFVEALRSDTIVHIKTAFGKLVAKIPGDVSFKEGEKAIFYIDANKIHLFSVENQQAVLHM